MTDLEFVTISSGDLTARINPHGAELWSLTDQQSREYMTNADPAFWTGHAPILFPIVGALRNDSYTFDGQEFSLKKHGFARHSRFEVIESSAHHALFRLTDNPDTRAAYPFAFILEVAFRLEGQTLHMAVTVSNPDVSPLPFSFGYHPAFAWPLPGGAEKSDHVIAFDHPEPQAIRRINPASGLLLSDPVPTPVEGHLLHLDAGLFEDDAVIWDDLNSRSLTYGAAGTSQLSISFPDTSMLGIWQKPNAAYLCIEPWQGIADPLDFGGDIREKPGVVTLPAGEKRQFRMDVAVLAAD